MNPRTCHSQCILVLILIQSYGISQLWCKAMNSPWWCRPSTQPTIWSALWSSSVVQGDRPNGDERSSVKCLVKNCDYADWPHVPAMYHANFALSSLSMFLPPRDFTSSWPCGKYDTCNLREESVRNHINRHCWDVCEIWRCLGKDWRATCMRCTNRVSLIWVLGAWV